MNRSSVIDLIEEVHVQNDYGVMESVTTSHRIFADVTSVSATEWFEGGRSGLNPEYRMTVFTYDYNGEEILEYNGVQYTIYRKYVRGDKTELYVQKRQGNV